MAFRTNNIERLRIEAGGDIGIGLTNPTSKLEVSGKTTTTNLKVTNGAAANKVLVSDAAGDATWQDVPSRTHTIHIPAIVMSNDVLISGTSFGTYNWNNRYVEFNDGNTETMVVNFSLPEDRTSNSYTLRILYTGNVTGNNFHIQTGAKSITTGELVGQNPGGGSTTIPGPSVANYLLEYTRGFSVASNDKWVMLYIRRNGSNTSDTNTGNLRVLAVIIEYEM
jgi:hypothetical protein